MKSVGSCVSFARLCLVLGSLWSVAARLLPPKALERLHIRDGERYETCPFHHLTNSQFACFQTGLNRTLEILDHTPEAFIDTRRVFSAPHIRGRTIFLAGDSMIRNQFVSLACLLWEADPAITRSQITRAGPVLMIHSPTYDVQILCLYSETLLDKPLPQLMNDSSTATLTPAFDAVMKGTAMPIHGLQARKPTYTVLSVAHHFARRRSQTMCQDRDASLPGCEPDSVDLYRFRHVLDRINTLVQRMQQTRSLDTQIIWRGAPTRHYYGGEWNTGGTCGSRAPCLTDAVVQVTQMGSTYWTSVAVNRVIRESATAHHFGFVDILPSTLSRCDGHVNKLPIGNHGRFPDCTHYCVPGVPETWHPPLFASFHMIF